MLLSIYRCISVIIGPIPVSQSFVNWLSLVLIYVGKAFLSCPKIKKTTTTTTQTIIQWIASHLKWSANGLCICCDTCLHVNDFYVHLLNGRIKWTLQMDNDSNNRTEERMNRRKQIESKSKKPFLWPFSLQFQCGWIIWKVICCVANFKNDWFSCSKIDFID